MASEEECTTRTSLYRTCKITTYIISVIIMAAFTIYVFYISFKRYTIYSWHPAFFTFGSLLLMTEAIILLSADFSAFLHLNRGQAVTQHWILQAGATVCTIVGFATIFVYKEQYKQTHFETFHGISGLVSVILFVVGNFGGIATLFSTGLKNWVKPAKIKCLHVIIGILTFLAGIVAEVTGFYTNWFLWYTSSSIQVVCTLLVALASIFALRDAMVSAYSRLKQVLF